MADPPVSANEAAVARQGAAAPGAGPTRFSALWARRGELALPLILLVAAVLRIYLAAGIDYIADEAVAHIPVADKISLAPGDLRLPIREGQHPALASYFIRFGKELFGASFLGYRSASLLAGVATVWLAYRMAYLWFGREAAIWTGWLLAFNEYHIAASALAAEKSFYLFFCSLAVFAFVQAVRENRPALLTAAGAAAGVAFLCKEIAVLMLPAFLVALLLLGRRSWLRRPEPYVACAIFALLILPDVIWNLAPPAEIVRARGYEDHFGRVGGIGLNVQPLIFWFRDAFEWINDALGREFEAPAREYPAMNLLFGLVLVSAVLAATRRFSTLEPAGKVAVVLFWVVCGFFTVIVPGAPRPDMDATVWFWVDLSLLSAVLLGGVWMSGLRRPGRTIARTLVAAACVVSAHSVLTTWLDFNRIPRELSAQSSRAAMIHWSDHGLAAHGSWWDDQAAPLLPGGRP